MKRSIFALTLLALVLGTGQAKADFGLSNTGSVAYGNGFTGLLGFSFTLTQSETITSVGIVDYASNPFVGTTTAAFYNGNTGALLAGTTTTISSATGTVATAGTTPFLFNNTTTPIVLGPGNYYYGVTYRQGIFFGAGGTTTFSSQFAPSADVAPTLFLSTSTAGFTPGSAFGTAAIGGTFSTTPTISVPEPASFAMAGMGLAAVGFVIRKRRV